MTDQASENATARIERALARIETSVKRGAADRAALERRHAALRREVTVALTALDSLIAGEGED